MQYGHIGYVVPHSIYPAGYHCDPTKPLSYAALGSQKNHMAIYLCNVYGNKETETWFRNAFAAAGKKLDMGKSCVRFKNLEQLPSKSSARLSRGRQSINTSPVWSKC